MFSRKTILEITETIENFTHSEIDRIIEIFDFKKITSTINPNKIFKTTNIYKDLINLELKGPFGGDRTTELLQYIIDRFHRNSPNWEQGDIAYDPNGNWIFQNAFSKSFPNLINSLLRDGYMIEGKTIKKLLPHEIVEAKTESELEIQLDKYGFTTTKEHLRQAIENHTQGNWAGANSQFRTFIESLLKEISGKILPLNETKTALTSIKLLSSTTNPPFFKSELNETSTGKDKEPNFINGLWARLNPEGSHPGLSDENDCTFRYHITLVFSEYIMKRLIDYV